jgi:hypothetical protein
MLTGETHRNLGDITRAAAFESAKPGVTMIVPWRMEANHTHEGFDACGCGFCPDDDWETIPLKHQPT